jgi:serine/threonine-protein kinase
MLPSFRLIATTFMLGFVVVFAGLRVAASLNDIHAALPVMAAQAAPVPVEMMTDPDMRRGRSAVPVMYDLRFVASTASLAPTLTRLTSPPERIAPPQPSAVIDAAFGGPLPAAAMPIEPPKPEILKPEATAPEARQPEAPKPETATVAAIDPQAAPAPEPPASIDIPLIEPAEVDLSPSATDTAQDAAAPPTQAVSVEPAAESPATEPPPAAAVETSAALPEPETPAPAVDLGSPSAIVTSPPIPKARPALRVRAKVAPKAAPKRRVRTARHAGPGKTTDDPFGNFGSFDNSGFKYPQKAFGSAN